MKLLSCKVGFVHLETEEAGLDLDAIQRIINGMLLNEKTVFVGRIKPKR